MNWLVTSIRENPELAIFLTLAIGFVIGRIRVGTFSLGSVVGTLLAGVLVGQIGVDVHPIVKVTFFALFLFATGYKVGPQFFRGLGRNAISQALLTVVLCVTSLLTTLVAAKVMRYDTGTAAGLMAGAFTESTVIGTAGNTIARLDLPEAEKTRLLNNIPVAYAVSYLVGTGFVVWFLGSLAPRLLRVDLKAESRKLEAQSTGLEKTADGTRPAYREWDVRAYRIPDGMADRSVADVEKSFSPARVFVVRVRRGGEILEVAADTVLKQGDVAVFAARRHVFLTGPPIGEEVEDRGLLDFPLAALDVVVTRKELADRTLADVAEEHGRGVALLQLVRGGEEIPFGPDTVLNRGDLLRVAGARDDVERVGKAIGYVERPSSATDIVFVGLGIFLGGLVGVLTLRIGDLPLSLTASGGALIMGLVFGWLRSVRPTFGRIPSSTVWFMNSASSRNRVGAF